MMKYFIFVFVFFCGCYDFGCFDNGVEVRENQVKQKAVDLSGELIEKLKKFTIVNHTNKTYKNNAIYDAEGRKSKGTWKIYPYRDVKINSIEAQKTLNKNEKGKALALETFYNCSANRPYENSVDDTKGNFLLFSMNGGKRKIFFGAYDYESKKVYGKRDNENCIQYYTLDIHPVWQEKDLTIHIYDDKITFSDPKIKEVKKVTASKSKEEIELKDLEIVPCDEE